jgi:hypothetical protein
LLNARFAPFTGVEFSDMASYMAGSQVVVDGGALLS